jgi:hypothetical protein
MRHLLISYEFVVGEDSFFDAGLVVCVTDFMTILASPRLACKPLRRPRVQREVCVPNRLFVEFFHQGGSIFNQISSFSLVRFQNPIDNPAPSLANHVFHLSSHESHRCM